VSPWRAEETDKRRDRRGGWQAEGQERRLTSGGTGETWKVEGNSCIRQTAEFCDRFNDKCVFNFSFINILLRNTSKFQTIIAKKHVCLDYCRFCMSRPIFIYTTCIRTILNFVPGTRAWISRWWIKWIIFLLIRQTPLQLSFQEKKLGSTSHHALAVPGLDRFLAPPSSPQRK